MSDFHKSLKSGMIFRESGTCEKEAEDTKGDSKVMVVEKMTTP